MMTIGMNTIVEGIASLSCQISQFFVVLESAVLLAASENDKRPLCRQPDLSFKQPYHFLIFSSYYLKSKIMIAVPIIEIVLVTREREL